VSEDNCYLVNIIIHLLDAMCGISISRARTARKHPMFFGGDVEGGYRQIVTAFGQRAKTVMTIFEDLINPF
jgi:hypothetical protein